jgi:hypothetical protein
MDIKQDRYEYPPAECGAGAALYVSKIECYILVERENPALPAMLTLPPFYLPRGKQLAVRLEGGRVIVEFQPLPSPVQTGLCRNCGRDQSRHTAGHGCLNFEPFGR